MSSEIVVKRHPIRGALWGLMLGVGVAIYLVIFSVTPFSITTAIVIAAVGLVFGILWGSVAPAKKVAGGPSNAREFGSTYASAADEGPSPTYEEAFSSAESEAGAATEAVDDGSFGAVADDSDGSDRDI